VTRRRTDKQPADLRVSRIWAELDGRTLEDVLAEERRNEMFGVNVTPTAGASQLFDPWRGSKAWRL
jgi:hypothetical protein